MTKAEPRNIDWRARIWWSLWVDPGDRIAGELIERWGAATAARKAFNAAQNRRLRGQGPTSPREAQLFNLIQRYPQLPSKRSVDHAIDLCDRRNIAITLPRDEQWPRSLDDLGPHRPLLIFSRGQLGILSESHSLVSVVGTRRPSITGASAARDISRTLATSGLIIVSGGALGIDAIAHRTALRAGVHTVVVAATSVDRDYPREHRGLFESVAQTGLLVSETPPGKPISPTSFLARNRLIAAFSRATIVVECPVRSGALSTASHAATLGRGLYSVTYRHESAEHAGNQRLIEEWGAHPLLYEGHIAQGVLEELPSASVAV
jgi:DNA processing protein